MLRVLSHKVQYSLTYTASIQGESPISPLFIKPVQNSTKPSALTRRMRGLPNYYKSYCSNKNKNHHSTKKKKNFKKNDRESLCACLSNPRKCISPSVVGLVLLKCACVVIRCSASYF